MTSSASGAAMPVVNPINALKSAVLQVIANALTNVQGAFTNLAANPTQDNAIEQAGVIEGQLATLELEAPAMVPGLEGDVIAAAAAEGANGIGSIISAINAQIAPSSGSDASGGSGK